MRLYSLVAFSLACFGFAALGDVHAFGQVGHQMVGDIASKYLDPQAAKQVAALLRGDIGANGKPSGRTTLGQVASWPDEIRDNPGAKAFAPWHFSDVPVCGSASPDAVCPKGNCASAQLARLLMVVRNPKASIHERNEALKWVVHLVGDIHQPLHAADNRDGGGNAIRVSFFGKTTGEYGALKLHTIWDEQIVEKLMSERGGAAAFLARTISGPDKKSWEQAPIAAWVSASNKLARTVAYAKQPLGFACGKSTDKTQEIGQDYYSAAAPVLELQIRKAGVRLAKVLNDALGAQK